MNRFAFTRILCVTLVVALGLAACDSGFEEMNQNPNAPAEVPASLVIPRAINTSVDRTYNMGGLNGYVGAIWAQHYAKIQYPDEDQYNFAGRITLVNSIWESFYARTLEDLNQVRQAAQEEGDPNTEAMADILMAWNFHMITDTWGDVPYSEALQGVENTSPRYDAQEDIYDGILGTLREAADKIDLSYSSMGSQDLLYGGDMSQWQKFANSLRLRAALRLSERDPQRAASEIQEVYADGRYFESHADNAVLRYMTFPNNNPVNDFARTREDHKISRTMVEALEEREDPRLRIYAVPVRSEQLKEQGVRFQGVQNASAHLSMPLSEASTMGAYFIAPTSPGRIMTYDEVLFVLSEAAARGWIDADAGALYNDAIRANMELYTDARLGEVLAGFPGDIAFNHQGLNAEELPEGIADEEIDAYLSQSNVQWDEGNWRQLIGEQKWIALYGQGLEAWFEWRRLEYPALEPGPQAVLNEVPTRLPYPVLEQSLNQEHYSEAVSRQGPDAMTTRVWWDD